MQKAVKRNAKGRLSPCERRPFAKCMVVVEWLGGLGRPGEQVKADEFLISLMLAFGS